MLPGGIHRANQISRQRTPTAFDDNGELKPCLLLKAESQTPWGPHEHSGRLYVTLFLYQRNYDTSQPDATEYPLTGAEDVNDSYIEMAAKRVYSLLHRVKLTPVDGAGNYEIVLSDELLGMVDPGLDADMIQLRYTATMQRG
jgi:hypothetical protein